MIVYEWAKQRRVMIIDCFVLEAIFQLFVGKSRVKTQRPHGSFTPVFGGLKLRNLMVHSHQVFAHFRCIIRMNYLYKGPRFQS